MANTFIAQQHKTYILIHGAWHGAWCWNKLVPLLEANGNKVIAPDLPGHGSDKTNIETVTLTDYVDKVVEVSNMENGSVILVGHSMAGIVISQAAELLGVDKVSALIYLDGFMPQNGESLFSLVEMVQKQARPDKLGRPSLMENIIPSADNRTCVINPEKVEWFFYNDCSEEDKKFALARVARQPMAPLGMPVSLTETIYGQIPKYYILCTEGNDLDKTMISTHVPCRKIYKLKSSHSPFFSMPAKLVEILTEID